MCLPGYTLPYTSGRTPLVVNCLFRASSVIFSGVISDARAGGACRKEIMVALVADVVDSVEGIKCFKVVGHPCRRKHGRASALSCIMSRYDVCSYSTAGGGQHRSASSMAHVERGGDCNEPHDKERAWHFIAIRACRPDAVGNASCASSTYGDFALSSGRSRNFGVP